MSKIIVIEGAEGSGKSTLARQLQRTWYGPSYCVHFSKPNATDPRIVKAQFTVANSLPDEYLVIWDRSWLSDIVYSTINKHHVPWTRAKINNFETHLQQARVKLILLAGSYRDFYSQTKVGCTIATEVETYLSKASSTWEIINHPTPSPEYFLGYQ